ncbi:MAG TPA: phosphoribosylamine--glycine ligase [Thiomicrospira sp.]|jgi:phosphoribosylamine--glycine ligase|nr:phosphoribosylamine--glycine ligase [Thiomicrospira sp.]
MNVLIIGSGGREHALAWKTAQSDKVKKVFVAPGNTGTALESNLENVDIQVDDIAGLVKFAQKNDIGLTIVGPEIPLVLGVVDAFEEAGLKCFGPNKAAAQLEGSKAFSKNFLAKHNIPTASYAVFTEIAPATEYINKMGAPIVVKADGLAAGKGVILADTTEEAISAVTDMLAGNKFGDAGSRVVIEEFLLGEEASFIVIADGKNILPMVTSQDHKARNNGDTGPNTGGMGAYTPAPVVTRSIHNKIMNEIIKPTIEGMAADGVPFTGFLYAGVIIDKEGNSKVLEFNVRSGDPETQPIMMRLQSDLAELCLAAVDKKLDTVTAKWDSRAALGVVLAAEGYPSEEYRKGDIISGIDNANASDIKVFHAGTGSDKDSNIITTGGRVLCVTALGENVTQAQARAYKGVDKISWQGMYHRNDIGHRAVNRELLN